MARKSRSIPSTNTNMKIPHISGLLRSEELHKYMVGMIAQLAPDEKLPSERAIAKETGLSLLTVNKVLATLVAEGFIERRTGCGTFVLERSAREYRSENTAIQIIRFCTRSVGRCLGERDSHSYISHFYQGLCDAAKQDGVEILPTPFAVDPDGIESLPDNAFDAQGVLGLVFVEEGTPDYRQLWKFLEEGRRIIAFDFSAPERGLSSVLFDNIHGVESAVAYCHEMGHQRIGYIGPATNSGQPGDERLTGYRQGMAAAGLDAGESFTVIADKLHMLNNLQALLSLPADRRPTAFIGHTEYYIMDLLEIASKLGLQIPSDVGFIGFGDSMSRDPNAPMLVDAISCDEEAMGRTAYSLAKNGARGVIRRQPARLIHRGSVISPNA